MGRVRQFETWSLRARSPTLEAESRPHRALKLEVLNDKLVRLSDIEALPFADFWRESSSGSTMLVDSRTGEPFVYLHDWEAFAELFIKTGKHRYQAR